MGGLVNLLRPTHRLLIYSTAPIRLQQLSRMLANEASRDTRCRVGKRRRRQADQIGWQNLKTFAEIEITILAYESPLQQSES